MKATKVWQFPPGYDRVDPSITTRDPQSPFRRPILYHGLAAEGERNERLIFLSPGHIFILKIMLLIDQSPNLEK
ncbi:hypothetical protein WH47_02441 [Habropoda laboriosa]|uniref:Uncharacterized protein n=1 Tax=Habropoda laboriosa TaxID=597456 RepID=A0A0L7QWK2_9HYME|nr:hypothetical protein WH47_02441 [Habropoda laboriosa]